MEPALSRALAEQRNRSYVARTPEQRAAQAATVEEVRRARIVERALGIGQQMPPFRLPAAQGGVCDSREMLASGPMVVSFYRGGWCPYCNLELRALQSRLADIRALGATLVAISPELPDSSLTTAEKNELQFPVLSDAANAVARAFHLVHEVTPDWVRYQQTVGIDVAATNGSDVAEVPLPATYVADADGWIRYAYVNADYTQRGEPSDVVAQLQALADRRR